ncbi:hypothetical protein [Streptomyces venetus]|uniref:hypothetical protein n=1 Tax=Streptomyces venetus TaxID=1701086 RepID=UPI003C2F9337
MHTHIRRTIRLLTVLAICTVGAGAAAGCGTNEADHGDAEARSTEPAPQSGARARQVADAWDGSKAAEAWHEGYHPMEAVVQPPENGLRSAADRRAYETGNFDLRGKLPSAPHKSGHVRWKSGSSLTTPLMEAEKAYKTLDRGSSPGPRLTVTGARLGEMTVVTTRGPATVPAWLFAVEGYAGPLKRAAVGPSKLPAPPIKPLGQDEVPTDVLAPLGGLTEVSRDSRSITVVATHGSCDDGPTVGVLETSGSVVLSASAAGSEDGNCSSEMRGEEVSVELDRPVGERLVLDAFTGRPVPYSEWPRTSQSWS